MLLSGSKEYRIIPYYTVKHVMTFSCIQVYNIQLEIHNYLDEYYRAV